MAPQWERFLEASGARSVSHCKSERMTTTRAHILSQRFTARHVYVHWRMLRLGASAGVWREVLGQATRILAAAIFSRIWVPLGNTGRANVSAMKPMPVPEDLRALLENGGL